MRIASKPYVQDLLGGYLTIADAAATYAPIGSGAITSIGSVASTSGTSIDFTGIPSAARRVTVLFNGVSLSGTAHFLIQIGNSSPETTGYASSAIAGASPNTVVGTSSTAGMLVYAGVAANTHSGILSLVHLGSNAWVYSATLTIGSSGIVVIAGGTKTTSGVVDRVRITTSNGTDTFDAGSINVLYES